jgi:hypothetical protein
LILLRPKFGFDLAISSKNCYAPPVGALADHRPARSRFFE